MVSRLAAERKTLQGRLESKMSEYEYRFSRYGIDFSIAVVYTPKRIRMSQFGSYIRSTDRYVFLGRGIYGIIFDCADHEKGIKAANNLLTRFQHTFFSTPIYASIVSANDYKDPSQRLSKLFDLLAYALRHNMDNLIMDDTQEMKTI